MTSKVHELPGAEAEVERFRTNLGPFVAAAQMTRMAMAFTDANSTDHRIIFANDSFVSLSGYPREELLGHSFTSMMACGIEPEMSARVDEAFAKGSESDMEIRYCRKDGSMFWADVLISPVRDETGNIVQYFASLIDLTKHREERAQCKMLIDELNHRVKNTLSTVQSIAWQASRRYSDPRDIRIAIESRLFALSRSHDLLTRRSWEGSGLLDIANEALEPFGAVVGRSERIVIDGDDIRVSPKTTLALGIAFHELATNAVKYGALSNETGSILLAWAVNPTPEGDRLVLRWQETGGPTIAPPSRKGFGSQVLQRGLAHELEGRVDLDYRPDGVVYTVDLPAPDRAVDG